MLISSQNLSLTLFVSLVLTLAVAPVDAHDGFPPHRRDHDNLKRLIRKRQLGSIINVVPDPNDPANNSASSASASALPVSPSASSASVSVSASALSVSASDSASASSVSASDSASASSSASASASVASVSSTTTSSSSTTTAAVQTPAPVEPTDAAVTTSSHEKSTVTKTNSVLAAAAATGAVTPQAAAAQSKRSTITTVLIAVAASVGGIAILWTVFRKWKLGHSSKFDERMAPIDWQPTNDDGIVPAHRRTNSRASSFNSSAAHGAGYGDRLEHDFTAAPTNLAPVGGYADLARGPSPQPQMQDLGRGPSMRGYNAGPNAGVPLHHQAGYGQAEAYDYNGDAVRF
ncbi:hypothetical protein DFH06DRAFT_486622 [Mycena polygramma]|nr:hypothetical protein DFH06DRAFT_486622 [Mycena polygramma]